MAYNLRQVIDVANKIQAMPPDRKTFGYGLGLVKGKSPVGQDLVMGPYTSADGVAEKFGSNAEIVRIATTYFAGGWFGKPYQFYVAYVDTETLSSLSAWTVGNAYQVGDKVSNGDLGYICTYPHASSGEFNTNLWTKSEVELPEATVWAADTQYTVGAKVKLLVSGTEDQYEYYTCNYAHTSGDEFQLTCWEHYVPTGKPIEEWMTQILQDSKNYYVILPSVEFAAQEQVAIAQKVESASQPKLNIETYTAANAMDNSVSDDLGSKLQALKLDRTMVVYDPLNAAGQCQYVSAAVLSGYATVSFTSARPAITMADKPLKGVTSLDLKDAQYSALQTKNYNFYTKTTDIDTDMFIDSRMASGQFFDTLQAADWLAYDMRYKLVNLVQTRDKIPFTEDGLALVKQTISETCVEALNAGIIGTGYDQDDNYIENGFLISMPALSDIPKADKAKRILRNVKVTFLLSGSIQRIEILNDIQL